MKDLDALPFPAWDLVDVDRYRAVWRARHGYYSMNLATTRGCPYHCNWCAKPIYGQRYAVRSPERVAAEMAWLKRAYAPDHVSFVDDIFGLRPGWVEAFADAVEAARRAAAVPVPLASGPPGRRGRGGAARARAAARSGSARSRARSASSTRWRRARRVEQIREAARRAARGRASRSASSSSSATRARRATDIDLTRALVRECAPDDIGISVSYPLPGTPFYERVRAELGAKQNWDDSADLAMMYRGPFPTAFYRELHRVVHHEFRLRRPRGRRSLAAALRRPPLSRGRAARVARRGCAASPAGRTRASRRLPPSSRARRPPCRASRADSAWTCC